MADPIDAGTHFDAAVRATAAFGELRGDVSALKEDVHEIKEDVKAIRADSTAMRRTIDHYAGAMVVVGSLISVAVSVVVAVALHFLPAVTP